MSQRLAVGRAPVGAVPGAPNPMPTSGHLDQLDLFRMLTFAVVVAVHTTANGSAGQGAPANGVEVFFHYTREAFFFLSGFVLAHSARDRPLKLRRFWPRRFKLVGIPYLVWSFLFICYAYWRNGAMAPGVFWHLLWHTTLLGQASYHLYFLLVSMQIYAVFPLLNLLRRLRTRDQLILLAGLAIADGLLLQFVHTHKNSPQGTAAQFISYWAYVTIFPYLYWIVGGSVVAWHLPAVQSFLWRHRLVIGGLSVLSFALAESVYAVGLHNGWKPQDAADVMQPVMLAWGSGAIALQALLSLYWVRHRGARSRTTRWVMWGSSASFGIYLIHPMILDRVFAHGFSGGPQMYLGKPWTAAWFQLHIAQPWASFGAWTITLALSCVVIGLVRLTPLSLPLTGREWGWRRKRDAWRARRPPAGRSDPGLTS